MLRPNPLKARLAQGKKCLGIWLNANNALIAEARGDVGYDFVMIDHEHGPGDLMGAIGQMQAMRSAAGPDKAPGFAMRVPWNDMVYIKRALDAGVESIMIPMVETVEQAKAAIAACKYPPQGVRGVALGATRASGYGGKTQEYWDRANAETCVIIQIETPRALENVAEIAKLPGADVLFIGPSDLSSNSGGNPLTGGESGLKAIARAEAAIKATGKPMATVPHFGAPIQAMFDRGYAMVIGAAEIAVLRRTCAAQVAEHRKHNPA